MSDTRPRIMAIASGGGHWVQLMRIMPSLADQNVFYVTLDRSASVDVAGRDFYVIRDVSRKNPIGVFVTGFQLLLVLLKERPKLVLTTGSAPGLLALTLAKYILRSKTIWIDSIANSERLSASGRSAGKVADLWLTQWPELAQPGGPEYWGAVL